MDRDRRGASEIDIDTNMNHAACVVSYVPDIGWAKFYMLMGNSLMVVYLLWEMQGNLNTNLNFILFYFIA